MDNEKSQRDDAADGIRADFQGLEPVDLLAAVQHQLQQADEHRQRREAEPIEAGLARFGLVAQVEPYPGERQYPHRQVDQEHPRSEEHTSELQSLMRISYAVFCLKKKKTIHTRTRVK